MTPYGNTPLAFDYNTYGAALSSGSNYLLDKVSGAKMAVSVRKLRYLYAGYYARVRRSDNAEQNITGNYGGYLYSNSSLENGLSLVDWLAGSEAFTRTWHDQSGNLAHAEQNTASTQFLLSQNGINTFPALVSRLTFDNILFYNSTVINPYLYGAGKKFTFHFVAQSNAQLSGDTRLFFHINSSGSLIKGLQIGLAGGGTAGKYKVVILCGDLVSTINFTTVNLFDNSRPHHLLVGYDGTVNTSWTDRFSVIVDGVSQPLQIDGQFGVFPADITQPSTTARLWCAASTTIIGSVAEVILWDRLLNTYETNFTVKNSMTAYGL